MPKAKPHRNARGITYDTKRKRWVAKLTLHGKLLQQWVPTEAEALAIRKHWITQIERGVAIEKLIGVRVAVGGFQKPEPSTREQILAAKAVEAAKKPYHKGVTYDKSNGRWNVMLRYEGTVRNASRATYEDAVAVWNAWVDYIRAYGTLPPKRDKDYL